MDKKHNYTNHGKSSKRLWITFLFFCIITTGFMQAACKVGSLTTEQILHVSLSFCLTISKGINSFFIHNIVFKVTL